MFRRLISIFLTIVLIIGQNLFYVPLAFAQEATGSAALTTVDPSPSPEVSSSPSPSPEASSTTLTPTTSPTPSLTPEATPAPTSSPTPTPILDVAIEKETSASASLKDKSTKSQASTKEQVGGLKKLSGKNYVEGEVLVKFRENKINLKQSSSLAKVEQFAAAKNLEVEDTLERSNVAVLETKSGESVESAITRLEADPTVEYAEPNYVGTYTTIASNDTRKNELWGLDNTNDNDIDAPEAWLINEGNNGVVVALLDTGVAYNHPDLAGNMWDGTNCKNESGVAIVGGCNYGFDFEENDNIPLPSLSSHGTHIAGTIAAVKDNNKGILGVAPSIKIMALKIGSSSPDVGSEVKAIDFAIQNGAKIINASFTMPFTQTEYDAINRFKAAGGIFIAAAGNGGQDLIGDNNDSSPVYPCNYDLDNIICVAATNQDDNLTSFSNFGTAAVDIAAPGYDILSTIAHSVFISENFDSVIPPSLPSGWTGTEEWGTVDFSGNKVLYGDYINIPYSNQVDTIATSPVYNLSANAFGATLSFSTQCDTEYTTTNWFDYMAIEASTDGSNYTEVGRWDEAYLDMLNGDSSPDGSSSYYFSGIDLSDYLSSNFQFRFRWFTDEINIPDDPYDGCFVDNISITKYYDGSNEQYESLSGTSMATPHVVGVAALIWSHNSNRTYSQVKSIILNTGDTKDSLVGKTVTGKRVNAHQALLATNGPTITGLENDATPRQSKTWNWDSTDSSDQYRFAVDQSLTWTPTGAYGSTKTATKNSADGTWYLHVQAKNSSGIESEVVTVSAVLDNTAPTTPGTPEPTPSSPTNETTQTWNWDASTDNLGTISYLWSIINAITSTLFSSGTTTNTSLVTNLLQGVWSFIVQAQDSAGNESEVASASITVDTTAAAGSITAPINNSYHKVIPDFTASANDAMTDVASVLFQYKASSSDTFIDLNTDAETPYAADWTGVTLTTNTTYNLQVVITDTAGNPSTIGGTSFTYDTTGVNAPSTPDLAAADDTGLSNTDNITNNTDNLTFTGTAEANSTLEIFDGTTTKGTTTVGGDGSWSRDISLTAEVHSITAKASDAAGNTSIASGALSVTVDTTAPSVPAIILLDPINNGNKTAVTITGTGEANNSFTYSVTDGVNAAITGSGTVAGNGSISVSGINVSGLNEGTLTASVTLTDVAGNLGSAGSDTATKDVSTPTLSNVSISSDNSNSNILAKVGDIVTVSFTSSETIQTPTVIIAGNTASVSSTGGNNWRADYQMASEDVNGTVSFTINFNDLGGNPGSEVSTTGDNTSIIFDKTAPSAFQVGSVITTGGNVVFGKWNASNTGVNITVPVANDSSLTSGTIQLQAKVSFPVEGQEFENVGSAYTILVGDLNGNKTLSLTATQFEAIAGLSDGDTVTFKAVITDNAGNSTTGTASVTGLDIDQTAPVVNITSPVTGDKVNGSKLITFTDNENENEAGLSGIRVCSIDNSTFVACNTSGVTTLSDITGFDGLGQGNFTLYFKDTDVAGNTGSTSQADIVKDTTAPDVPVVISPSDTQIVNADNATVAGTAEAGSLVKVKSGTNVVGSQQLSGSETAFSISVSLTQNSVNNFTVTATDVASNESIQATVSTITEDSTNPTITVYTLDNIRISPQASIGTKDTATIDLAFSEQVSADIDILNSLGIKVLDFYNSASVTNPQSRVWDGKDNATNYVAEGTYTIKVVITDKASNSITDTSKTINVDNSPLSLTPIDNETVNEEVQLIFTAQADDEEGGILTFSLTGAPTGAAINSSTGVFSWTPTEAQGPDEYTFTVSVSSSTGISESEEITVTVNEVNTAPVASGSTQTTDEDTAKVITLLATDADEPVNTLTYSIVSNPTHGTLSTISGNLVTYTPTANYNGSDSFTFRANDGTVDSNTSTINITINSVNDIPIATGDNATTQEDTAVNVAVLANDTDADGNFDPTTLTVTSGPSNGSAEVNSTIGSIIYAPAANFNGTDSLTYSVSDTLGANATATVNITVNGVNDAPSFDAIANQNIDEDASSQNISITNVSSGPDDESGQTVTFSATSSNPSVIPNPTVSGSGANRTLTYTPIANANGSATITVTANDGESQNNTTSRTFTITINPVNDAPTIIVTSPNGGEAWSGIHNVTWSATDTDNDTLTIDIQYSANSGADWIHIAFPQNTGSYGVDTHALSDGDLYLIRVIASDATLSAQDDSDAVFTIDNTAPDPPTALSLTDPINNSNITEANVILTGFGEAFATVNYTISDENNGTADVIGTGTVADDGSITINANDVSSLSDGTITASITLTDAAGNTGSAGTITATKDAVVPNTPPAPIVAGDNIINYEEWNNDDIEVTGTAEANSSVTVTLTDDCDGNSSSVTDLADVSGNYSFTLEGTSVADGTGLCDGNIFVSVTAQDAVGNVSNSQDTTVTQDTTSPSITIDSYNADPTNTDVTVTASTEEGSTLNTTTHTFSENGDFEFVATDSAGNTATQTVSITNIDKDPPTVITKLGDNSTDVVLTAGSNTNLIVFSKALSSSSQTAVQNALIAGADKELSFGSEAWVDSYILTITATETTTFANDVIVNVSDLAGNSAELLLVDSALSSTQKAPDGSGDVTIDDTTPEVVITDPDQEVDITIDSGTDNPTINVSSFITNGTGTLPKITIDSEKADIAIPASTTVTSADPTWNGVIAAPTVTTVTLPETAGETKTLSTAIEVGFSGAKLSFDKAVRILLPGQAGKRAGYVRTGIAFTEITNTCAADNQATGDALVADGECKIDSGLDLVIWTKHFTKFASYTQTTNATSTSTSSTSSTSGGGGGDGGDGLGCAVHDCSGNSVSQNLVLGVLTPSQATGFIEGVLGVEKEVTTDDVKGESVMESPQPSSSVPSNPFSILFNAIGTLLAGILGFFTRLFSR